MAQRFDADKLQVTGEAFPVVEHLRGPAQFSVSENGVLVYITGNPERNQLTWFNRSGNPVDTLAPPGGFVVPGLSPDEKRVTVVRVDHPPTTDIWLIDQRGVATAITSNTAYYSVPVWSPDGTRIAFASNREGVFNLYQKLSSGAGNEEELLKSNENKDASDWSPDGRFILYGTQREASLLPELWVLPLFGDRKPYSLNATCSKVGGENTFSPNGRWVAYVSNETGRCRCRMPWLTC